MCVCAILVLLWYQYQSNSGFIEGLKMCLLISFFLKFEKIAAKILQMFGMINQWAHWSWTFICQEIFENWFNICTCYSVSHLVVSNSLRPHRHRHETVGFSVYGILQARILKWVAILFSSRSSQLRGQNWVSGIVGIFFTIWVSTEALL